MKLIAFEQVDDGGLILHTPAGKRKVFAGDDAELGVLVRAIVADEAEPNTTVEQPAGGAKKKKRSKAGVMGGGPPRRRSRAPDIDDIREGMPQPNPGESADSYVGRLAGGAFQGFWSLLQRASD
jgi:hypothetical protein